MADSAKRPAPKTTANAIAVTDRQVKALQLRRAGFTLDAIAKTLGYAGPSGARYAIERALERTVHEGADALRSLELERLDRLQLGIWQQAVSGDLRAIDRILRIMVRRANLLGLDAPKRQENEIIVRDMAQKVAKEFDLDPDLIIREAERIIGEAADEL